MVSKYTLLFTLALCLAGEVWAQSSYIPSYTNGQYILDRFETMDGALSDELHLTSQPLHQRDATGFLMKQKSNVYSTKLSNVDMYNVNKLLYTQAEWLLDHGGTAIYYKDRNLIKPFYNNPAVLIEHPQKKLYFSLNPKFGIQYGNDTWNDNVANRMLVRAGAEFKATIGNTASVFFDYTYNSEGLPFHYAAYESLNEAVPGAGSYNTTTTGSNAVVANYHLIRGHIDFRLLKNNMNLTLGYGKHKLGDGYRSLMLSDFSEAAWFARLQTRIWKLKYQNIYAMHQPQTIYKGYSSATEEYKFATSHHLSINFFKWLNVGLFESVMFGRKEGYELAYINPIIFYRSVERAMGSPDKIIIGLNAKAIPVKQLQLYGQFIINEFSASEFFGNNGYWGNKWGGQLGLKYFNVANISNLDFQLEGNVVRPYTYSANVKMGGQILTNYSHFNQALAHPLGAGFREAVAQVRYQPLRRLSFDLKGILYQQTLDTMGNASNGVNILKNYDNRTANYGVKLVDPNHHATTMLANMNISYEAWVNGFFEVGATYRHTTVNNAAANQQLMLYMGFRLNLDRKSYTQF